MLPWDIIRTIRDFCPLHSRYVFAVTCRYFMNIDWQRFSSVYRLDPCTRDELKDLILREFSSKWSIAYRNGVVWNAHLNQPLKVWSPWSSNWGLLSTSTSITFSNWRFLEFVRHLGAELVLKTPCISYAYGHKRVVRVFVSHSARMPVHLIRKSRQRRLRSVWQHLFKKKKSQKVRALLAFRIGPNDCLRLNVKGLEFVASY